MTPIEKIVNGSPGEAKTGGCRAPHPCRRAGNGAMRPSAKTASADDDCAVAHHVDRGWIAGVALVMPGLTTQATHAGVARPHLIGFSRARRGAPPHAGEPYMPQPAIPL